MNTQALILDPSQQAITPQAKERGSNCLLKLRVNADPGEVIQQ
jgi:hypothetical protein